MNHDLGMKSTVKHSHLETYNTGGSGQIYGFLISFSLQDGSSLQCLDSNNLTHLLVTLNILLLVVLVLAVVQRLSVSSN